MKRKEAMIKLFERHEEFKRIVNDKTNTDTNN